MKKKSNLETRYLFLKRFIAYYPSTVFLRNSIIKITREYYKYYEVITVAGIVYVVNRVLIFIVVASYVISIIEAIYFFVTEQNEKLKFKPSYILYILDLDFNLILLISFLLKSLLKVVKTCLLLVYKFISKVSSLIKRRSQISIKSIFSFLKIFFSRVMQSGTNIVFLPITGPAFIIDKFLEPIEIRLFYQPLPITYGSPFFLN
jgi:hypothetical protein